jgi:hypothetical protein
LSHFFWGAFGAAMRNGTAGRFIFDQTILVHVANKHQPEHLGFARTRCYIAILRIEVRVKQGPIPLLRPRETVTSDTPPRIHTVFRRAHALYPFLLA